MMMMDGYRNAYLPRGEISYILYFAIEVEEEERDVERGMHRRGKDD